MGAIPAAIGLGMNIIGNGADFIGDTMDDIGDYGQSEPIQNPIMPFVKATGGALSLAGAGASLLGAVLSDEGQKDVCAGVQDILNYLFNEYLGSPEFKKELEPYAHDYIMSDMNQKVLRNLANKKEPLSDGELAIVSYLMGKGNGDLDPMESGEWTDDMVQEYAENLRNFLYTYKDSAKEVDPSIDPNEYHRGPMAQDIEKVAPDCVKETEQGVKVVDGNRLALVNAGVIGDLARRLIELEDKVYGN